ncbi:RDD family protein [Erythrobacter sp. THAF29]|uniref:RDD family protein n=1 Tax=Erythrobacter sp. THAF29 TaxID=2587851 RepID=UPI001268017C|nr:RDD family protein [Erythrobacter sp. THAF29]QFT78913.1 RDD family protein [Erythrobacter sp. THAF29]
MNAATAITGYENKRERILITPEGLAVPVTIASRGSRLGALVLDFVLLFLALIIFQIVLLLIFGGLFEDAMETANENISGAGEFLFIVLILVGFLARYGYFLGMELGPRGATFGKRMVGIRVAARNGGRLTPEAVIARNLLRDIELFMPLVFLMIAPSGEAGNFGLAGAIWFLVFMLFPFFNKDALRAGDVIAGTWVLEAPRTKLADALSTQGAAAKGSSEITGVRYEFGEAELSIYGEHELQTLERMLRDAQPDALSAVHETICRKIGWDPGAGDERAFLEAFYAQLRAKLEGDMRFGKRKANKFS